MNRRSSRAVTALARWALMAGLAGIVLSLLALVDYWRAPENLDARRNLLIAAAVLLSLAFVFAPFVRRAFGVLPQGRAKRDGRKTLLDEMRERPQAQWGEPMPVAPADIESPQQKQGLFAKLIVVLYVVFGATLCAVVLAMR